MECLAPAHYGVIRVERESNAVREGNVKSLLRSVFLGSSGNKNIARSDAARGWRSNAETEGIEKIRVGGPT
jgi:hypothetical protein